jgi:hypothetical protein
MPKSGQEFVWFLAGVTLVIMGVFYLYSKTDSLVRSIIIFCTIVVILLSIIVLLVNGVM